jgi:uncharacterized protein YndB with AHSA1/START domain
MSTDRIEKQIDLKAPVSRVWKALTNHEEFGKWFGVKMETPFVPGEKAQGRITHKGYEDFLFELWVVDMVPEKSFSFHWHPYAVDRKVDYSKEEPTLVVFNLEKKPDGTRLEVVESGFDKVPAARRAEAFRMNEGGWAQQMVNIDKYVRQAA